MEKNETLPQRLVDIAWDLAYESNKVHPKLKEVLDAQLEEVRPIKDIGERAITPAIRRNSLLIEHLQEEFDALQAFPTYVAKMEKSPLTPVSARETPTTGLDEEQRTQAALTKVINFRVKGGKRTFRKEMTIGEFVNLEDEVKLLLAVGQVTGESYASTHGSEEKVMEFVSKLINKTKPEEEQKSQEEVEEAIEAAIEKGDLHKYRGLPRLTLQGVMLLKQKTFSE